jgi:hypothetical protein
MNKASFVKKIFSSTCVGGFLLFWYLEVVDDYLETVNIKCHPSPVEVICHISNEPSLGGINLDVPKTQIVGIESIHRSMDGNIIYWIALATVDKRRIPLHRSPQGKIINQLIKHKVQIAKFIADPQARTLTIETHRRNIPLQMLVVTGGILLFSCLYLKKLWTFSKSDTISKNNDDQ